MVSKLGRVLVIAAGAACIISVPVGAANAAQTLSYTTNVIGPFSSQSDCSADAAAANDPPQDWTSACRFSATYPGTSVSDPGWYFNLHILITP